MPVADIGAWSEANPPDTDFVLKAGVQYAMEPFRGGFAVTDGHHNRVVYARRDGEVRELLALDNVVPTGLAAAGRTLFMGLAGRGPPSPRGRQGRRDRAARRGGDRVRSAAGRRRGARPDRRLYALSQGIWRPPGNPGSPASADTGSLTRVDHGRLTPVAGPLDRPTSVAFSRRSAFVVTLTGKVMRIDGIGHRRW